MNTYTAALGIGCIVGIFLIRRFARPIPGALVALVTGIALSYAFDLEAKGVAVVGEVSTGIPVPGIPSVPFGDIVFLLTGAFGIVFLALARSIGAARAFGVRHDYDIDPNRRLIALGAANAGAGLFGGFPVDASSASRRRARRRATGRALVAHHGGARPRDRDRPCAVVREAPLAVLSAIVSRRSWASWISANCAGTSPGSGPTSCLR